MERTTTLRYANLSPFVLLDPAIWSQNATLVLPPLMSVNSLMLGNRHWHLWVDAGCGARRRWRGIRWNRDEEGGGANFSFGRLGLRRVEAGVRRRKADGVAGLLKPEWEERERWRINWGGNQVTCHACDWVLLFFVVFLFFCLVVWFGFESVWPNSSVFSIPSSFSCNFPELFNTCKIKYK